jgi:hypothetical protein
VRPKTQGNSFLATGFLQTAAPEVKTPNEAPNKTSSGFYHNIANLTSPHLDFSLRLAKQSAFEGA